MHKLVGACLVLTLIGIWLVASSGEPFHAGECPLGHGIGIPVPERDTLDHCECEKWWGDHAPARMAFADCSKRDRVENCAGTSTIALGDGTTLDHTDPPNLIYVDLKLYRCPHCGMLFTEPE